MLRKLGLSGGVVALLVLVAVVIGLQSSSTSKGIAPTSKAVSQLGPLTLVVDAQAGSPAAAVAQSTAEATAQRVLAADRTHFASYRVTNAAFMAGLTGVVDAAGHPWYRTTLPENDWAMFLVAPAQAGWKYVEALVVVNGESGVVESYQVRYSNLAADAVPGA